MRNLGGSLILIVSIVSLCLFFECDTVAESKKNTYYK